MLTDVPRNKFIMCHKDYLVHQELGINLFPAILYMQCLQSCTVNVEDRNVPQLAGGKQAKPLYNQV